MVDGLALGGGAKAGLATLTRWGEDDEGTMADAPDRTISCPRCGGAAVYAAMVGMPANAIYQCDGCGRTTWVPRRPVAGGAAEASMQQQQQPQPAAPDDKAK